MSVEIVRVCQAQFMQWDARMITAHGQPDEQQLIVRNSNVNEELGQVFRVSWLSALAAFVYSSPLTRCLPAAHCCGVLTACPPLGDAHIHG